MIGSYTFLPSVVEGAFERSIQKSMGLSAVPEVSLVSQPPPNLLTGEFESGRIVLKDADFEGVRPDITVIDLDPFDINVLGSLGGALRSKRPLSGTVRMDLSEKEVARLANAGVSGPMIGKVRLEPSRVTVGVQATVMGMDVPVSVIGALELRGQTLVFKPRGISAFGVPLPQKLSDRLVAQAAFEYPLVDLPYDTEVSDVRLGEGKVIFEGKMGRVPMGRTGG